MLGYVAAGVASAPDEQGGRSDSRATEAAKTY
ncbi:hypothetical protein M2163_001458 [Streptomyces sp. SAI-135]|nr:hypothetical protein [Streptomyces sp. SAI-090]MDH6553842.1 hypothetical protein [Streptomyces sp. SAI-041]MDH6572920.1 hypothetical protein [Streptomyces sp. SAI-117]MDH6582118.1 hypothetical protein [Streptomyces sp. SAI-133]MDH6614350.1 hypothetical protein [Streptomyces sp. SAI-135]